MNASVSTLFMGVIFRYLHFRLTMFCYLALLVNQAFLYKLFLLIAVFVTAISKKCARKSDALLTTFRQCVFCLVSHEFACNNVIYIYQRLVVLNGTDWCDTRNNCILLKMSVCFLLSRWACQMAVLRKTSISGISLLVFWLINFVLVFFFFNENVCLNAMNHCRLFGLSSFNLSVVFFWQLSCPSLEFHLEQ